VGAGGDWFIQDRGNLRLRPAGESRWIDEKDFNESRGFSHKVSRLTKEGEYSVLEAAGKAAGYNDLGLPVPSSLEPLSSQLSSQRYPDFYAVNKVRLEVLRGAYPQERRYSMDLARHNQGWYVPETRILPLGDNRDNSRDGRFFGPVMSSRILGRASIIYWPGDMGSRRLAALDRFGSIR